MGSITHPCILVMLFMVTSDAAMVHSTDDKDARSVTEGHVVPHELRSLYSAVFRSGERIQSPEPLYGNYKVCVVMSPQHEGGKGTEVDVLAMVEFGSGEKWNGYRYLGKTGVPANSRICYDVLANYYEGDRVDKIWIRVFDVSGAGIDSCGCSFFPRRIVIDGPEDCDHYVCDWWLLCCQHGGGGTDVCEPRCYITDEHRPVPILCTLENSNC